MIITVHGEHEESRQPERATVSLSLSFESADRAEPIRLLRDAVQQLAGELEHLRTMTPSPITWSSIGAPGTRSWRPWNNQGKQLALRHAATARATVKFRDFDELGRWAATWGERAGWNIGYVEWTLTQQQRDDLGEQVLAAAVDDARRRAQVMATAAGAGTVRFLELSDPGLLEPPPTRGAAHAMFAASGGAARSGAAEEGLVIAPEDVRVQASVHARFEA